MKEFHLGKRAWFYFSLNMPYWNKYKVGHWTLLTTKIRTGYDLDYSCRWIDIDIAFLFLRFCFEWRVLKDKDEYEEGI